MDRNAVLNSAPYVAEFARVEGLDAHNHSIPVSYTHLDVYKRQGLDAG